MMRWALQLTKLMAGTVLITAISVYTTVFVASKYIDGLLQKYHLDVPKQSAFNASDWLEGISPYVQSGKPNNTSQTDTQSDGQLGTAKPQQDNALPVFGQQSRADNITENNAQVDKQNKDKLVITAEQFNERRKLLTNADKLAIYNILATNLSAEELQDMSGLLEEGITQKDLDRIIALIEQKCTAEDVHKLNTILNKYESARS